jgi:hypothetical protein
MSDAVSSSGGHGSTKRSARSAGANMSDWLMKKIKAEAQRLIPLAADDEELRADLRSLAEWILAATAGPRHDEPCPAEVVKSSAAPDSDVVALKGDHSTDRDGARLDGGPRADRLRELTFGRPAVSKVMPRMAAAAKARPRSMDAELAEIETRCRRKGDAARWAAERVRQLRENCCFQADEPPGDQEMVRWADSLTDKFFWLSASSSSTQVDAGLLDDVSGCFETLAEAVALARGALEKQPAVSKALDRLLPLLSEAQSAVRAAMQRVGASTDDDQLEVFKWLKETTARHRVYVERFMRADDPADSTRWSELLERIESLVPGGTSSRQHDPGFERLRAEFARPRGEQDAVLDWSAIIATVDNLIADGVPPSNKELRELLLPVIDDIPERSELPAGFQAVLREIDRFLATRPNAANTPAPAQPSGEVKEVARLLRGRSVVLIGGNRRREAQESLKRVLGLKDLVWIETREHQSIDGFEPVVARPDVALVLLAIRWSSHAFGDVKQFCERYGKPLVRLPAGYNLNQVAAQILLQCSDQLDERAAGA